MEGLVYDLKLKHDMTDEERKAAAQALRSVADTILSGAMIPKRLAGYVGDGAGSREFRYDAGGKVSIRRVERDEARDGWTAQCCTNASVRALQAETPPANPIICDVCGTKLYYCKA